MSVNGHEQPNKLNAKLQSKFQPPISFEWDEYLKGENGAPAPIECFNQNVEPPANEFELQQKLEITSPDSSDFVHLATVVSFVGCRLQLRLDGCDNSNDIFELVDSETIHSIGTHQLRNKYFAAPLRFRKDAASYSSFCQQILKNSISAPKNAFKTPPKPPPRNLFQPGMKLEAVDIKHASNICPATVASVDRNHVFIELDGWDSTNGFKTSYLSRNLFPVGWCKKTGHILQKPGPKVDLTKTIKKEIKEVSVKESTTPNPSTTTTTTTNNNNISKSATQLNAVIKKDDHECDNKVNTNSEVKQSPKPTATNISNSLNELKNTSTIPNKTTPNQCHNKTDVAINTISITTTTTSAAMIAPKLSNAHVISKSNNDHPPVPPIRNANFHKNEKSKEYQISKSNNVPGNVVHSGLKRPFEQIDNSAKPISNVVHANFKSIAPNSIQQHKVAAPQVKSPLQLKPVPQPNSLPHSKLIQQAKPLAPGTYVKQANYTLQPRTAPLNVLHHKPVPQANVAVQSKPHASPVVQPKPPVHPRPIPQQIAAPHSKLNQPNSRPVPTSATNVPVVNGNKSFASSGCQYKVDYPSSKVVNGWSVEDVIQFLNLRISEFSKCEQQFRSHEIDGKAFLLLTNEPMMKFMQIKLGLSLKICNIVDKINGSSP